jgi:hypothetical protein
MKPTRLIWCWTTCIIGVLLPIGCGVNTAQRNPSTQAGEDKSDQVDARKLIDEVHVAGNSKEKTVEDYVVYYAKRPAVDYVQLFSPGTVYYDAEAREGRRKLYCRIEPALDIEIPTGEISISLPESLEDHQVFTRKVTPGRYRTDVAIVSYGDRERLYDAAAWRIRFSDAVPVKWELGCPQGHTLDELDPFAFYGLGVDGALGLCDLSVAEGIIKHYKSKNLDLFEDFYMDVFMETKPKLGLVELNIDGANGNYLGIHTANSQKSYWGLNESGEPVWLVLDFGYFQTEKYESIDLGLLRDKTSRFVDVETRIGTLTARFERPTEDRHQLKVTMTGDSDQVFARPVLYINDEPVSAKEDSRSASKWQLVFEFQSDSPLDGSEAIRLERQIGVVSFPILTGEQ